MSERLARDEVRLVGAAFATGAPVSVSVRRYRVPAEWPDVSMVEGLGAEATRGVASALEDLGRLGDE